jgi:hypothetical protein
MTKIFTFLVGQSCRSALNSWAAQQHRPTDGVKILVMHRGVISKYFAARAAPVPPAHPSALRDSED